MSHLPHVIDFKQELTGLGIGCPLEQKKLVQAVITRVALAQFFKAPIGISDEKSKKVWAQLDKWNSVFPINAPLVFADAEKRYHTIVGNLANSGRLVDVGASGAVSTDINVGDVIVAIEGLTTYPALYAFLAKELESGNE